MKLLNVLFVFLFLSTAIFGQEIKVKELTRNSNNFYETKKVLDAYFANKPTGVDLDYAKNREWRNYKRWENNMRDRLMPDSTFGNRFEVSREMHAAVNKARAMQRIKAQSAAGWTCINQTTCTGEYNGMGRATSIAIHPTNHEIVYVGTSDGGLWRTEDAGLNYTPLTDYLPMPAAENVIVDHTKPNTIYITLGKYSSAGIYKSDDEGVNWNPTGLTFDLSAQVNIGEVAMSPLNNNNLIAATSNGLYKTTDAGNTWKRIAAGNYMTVCYKINSDSIIYAAKREAPGLIMKSVNAGTTWTSVYALPINNPYLKLEVSQADENFVAISVNGKIYSSVNEGITWTAKGQIPGSAGSMPTYFAISPKNTNIMLGGYFETYRSTDGGLTWVQRSSYYKYSNPVGGITAVHADIHAMRFAPSNPDILYIGNDGGMYFWNEKTQQFTERTNGLIITMFYDIKASQTEPYFIIGGTQDNGGRRMNSDGTWVSTNGGDGMTQAIDYTDPRIMYTSYAENMYRYYYFGTSLNVLDLSSRFPGGKAPANGEWELPFRLDPNNQKKIIACYDTVWASPDRGATWSKISSFNFGGALQEMAMSKANSNVIYVSRNSNFYASTDAGKTWVTRSLSTLLGGQRISSIEVNPSNANQVWISCSGYSAQKKVFKSTDGGANWTNISGTIPNVVAYDIIYEEGSNERLFLGTDCGGIYYRDATMSDWAYYGDGLPNSEIKSVDIRYADRKLIVGTYGRGIWIGDLPDNDNLLVPFCDFAATNTVTAPGRTVVFNDQSTNTATSWFWSFPGGTPSTSTLKTPSVTYAAVGNYDVSLTVTNFAGSTSKTKPNYITVNSTFSSNTIVTKFNASVTEIEGGTNVVFSDLSTGTPTHWEWVFEGGNPATSSEQHPTVYYATKGIYSVALTAKNAKGSNTLLKPDLITVNSTVSAIPNYQTNNEVVVFVNKNDIVVNTAQPTAKAYLYNLDGKLLITKNLEIGESVLYSTTNAGVYVVKVVLKKKVITNRIVIE